MPDVLRGCRRGLAARRCGGARGTALTACRVGVPPSRPVPQPGAHLRCPRRLVRRGPGRRAAAGRGAARRGGRASGAGSSRRRSSSTRPTSTTLRARLARCTDAGLGVVLTPGFQYAPAWVARPPGRRVPRPVRRREPREGAELRLQRDGPRRRGAVPRPVRRRVPARRLRGRPGRDERGGRARLPGQRARHGGQPLLGVRRRRAHRRRAARRDVAEPAARLGPGDRTWQGRPVDAAAVRSWFDWYAGSAVADDRLADRRCCATAATAARSTCRSPGGASCPPTSPRRRRRRSTAPPTATGAWSGACSTPTSCGRSPAPTDAEHVCSPTSTGVDDATAVAARELDPPQDTCQAGGRDAPAARHHVGRHLVRDALDRRQRPRRRSARRRREPGAPGDPGNRRRRLVRRPRRSSSSTPPATRRSAASRS